MRMRKRVLTLVAACFYYSGLVGLAHLWMRRQRQLLVILVYHNAAGGDFRRHLLYLKRRYRIMHLDQALEELYTTHTGKVQKSERRIPLAITFDDGYRDNYTDGFALARELQVPMTIFLVSGYIESGNNYWWQEANRLLTSTQVDKVTIEGRTYLLHQTEDRRALAQTIDSHLRYAKSVAEREAFLSNACQALAVPVSVPSKEDPSYPFGWEEAKEMLESGYVSFGAHTMHHPILAHLTDQEEMQREVSECKIVLEKQLNQQVRTFAYPVGQAQHISGQVMEAVQAGGYHWAVTTTYGVNRASTNPYQLRRIEVDVNQHWLIIAVQAAGLWGFFSRLRWVPFIRKRFTDAAI